MSKITKLILQPKKFLNDSLWFRKDTINITNQYKNIFIISHLGQLTQVESLIEYEQIKNCLLVILYTNKNTKVPKSIQNQYNKNLFDNSILFLLPNSPNNYKIKSLLFMRRSYEELITTVNPNNLYLLSFENHYSLLADVAKKENVNIHLIDEGTATYKSPDLSEYHQKQTMLKKVIAKRLKVDKAFTWTTKFDTVYAAFPELLKSTFQANSYNRFFAHAGQFNLDDRTSKLLDTYNITSNDFIYVNQRYPIQDNDFVDTILEILHKIGNHQQAKIFIKMHPKDSDTLKNNFIDKLHDYQNIIFIQENEFLIEPAIQAVNPKGVIGLTSTSLVYTPLISPKTKVYSIKPWFINLLPKENNQTGINIINDHYTILQQFKHVNVLNKDMQFNKELANTPKNSLNISYNNYIEYAKLAYKENKYQKSIINYIWAYPNGIESMPLNDFILYLNALQNKNDLQVQNKIINTWIDSDIINNKEIPLKNYTDFINLLINILIKHNNYSTYKITESLYSDLIALITSKIPSQTYPTNLLDTKLMIQKEYIKEMLPLLEMDIEKYIFNANYNEAIKLLNYILQDKSYLSNNEYLYISLLNSFIYLKEETKLITLNTDIHQFASQREVKLTSDALIAMYQTNYNKTLELLLPELNNFNFLSKQKLHPELIIARAYRLLKNYQDAKLYLIAFEKHTKGNPLCHKEIAYLEYSVNNHTKALIQFNKAYPKGINTMPMNDFIIYLDLLHIEQNYEEMYTLTKSNLIHTQISYYYLVALYKLNYYTKYLQEHKKFNLDTLTLEKKESISWITIKINRNLGNIEDAYLMLQSYNTLTMNNINNLLCAADIFELSKDYKKANGIWKIIIKSFHHEMPDYAWDRYYKTLDLALSC